MNLDTISTYCLYLFICAAIAWAAYSFNVWVEKKFPRTQNDKLTFLGDVVVAIFLLVFAITTALAGKNMLVVITNTSFFIGWVASCLRIYGKKENKQ